MIGKSYFWMIKLGLFMAITLACDVYGTLINTHGVIEQLQKTFSNGPDSAVDVVKFSTLWRDKQLEYSFRRGLMKSYLPFSICTRDALRYTASVFDVSLTEQQESELLACYAVLPAFDDVSDALKQLNEAGIRCFAFSNGTAAAVEGLLSNAGIRDYFDGIVSVDDLQTFKPNPDVYHYFIKQAKADIDQTWLVSSNPFDVLGALSVGFKAAWIQRTTAAKFDTWCLGDDKIEPTITVDGLPACAAYLLGNKG